MSCEVQDSHLFPNKQKTSKLELCGHHFEAGGLLIAMPAHLNPSVQLPKALSLEAAWELAGGVFMANHGVTQLNHIVSLLLGA